MDLRPGSLIPLPHYVGLQFLHFFVIAIVIAKIDLGCLPLAVLFFIRLIGLVCGEFVALGSLLDHPIE